jgi:2-polyprenyl-6-methoxyphenol hydroxylase-like FAD-dependent oxidoreductase
VALLGDAAFLARPHPGAGTTKAALDAASLADAVAEHGLDRGLARYQRLQGAFGSGIVQQGRRDGAYLSDQLKPRAQRRNQDLTWGVDDLMHDHNARSEVLRNVLEASRRATE